jgi:hypothetical protein
MRSRRSDRMSETKSRNQAAEDVGKADRSRRAEEPEEPQVLALTRRPSLVSTTTSTAVTRSTW